MLALYELRWLWSIFLTEILRLLFRSWCFWLLILDHDLDVWMVVLWGVLDVSQLSMDVSRHLYECPPMIQDTFVIGVNWRFWWLSSFHLLNRWELCRICLETWLCLLPSEASLTEIYLLCFLPCHVVWRLVRLVINEFIDEVLLALWHLRNVSPWRRVLSIA